MKQNVIDIIVKKTKDILWGILNRNDNFRDIEFSDLEPDSPAGKIAIEVQKWDFKDPLIMSFLSSSNGCGKTHLAICSLKKFIYNLVYQKTERILKITDLEEVYKKTYRTFQSIEDFHGEELDKMSDSIPLSVCFLREAELYNELIAGMYNKDTEADVLKKYFKADFLVYDDLFAYRDSDLIRRSVYYLLDERLCWRNKATMITSNYNIEQIKAIDSRIISRMSAGRIFEIENSKNYRAKKL